MNKRGFTLAEVLIAMVILSIVLLGLGRFVGVFLHSIGSATVRTEAAETARSQMENIRSDPTYPLSNTYAGTVVGFPGFPNMQRITVLTRRTGNNPRRDYTVVTIKVTEPTMLRPGTSLQDTVNLTAVVAAP